MKSPKQPGQPDTKPWDQKTPDERAACVLDHLAIEQLSGNLRPASETAKRAAKPLGDPPRE